MSVNKLPSFGPQGNRPEQEAYLLSSLPGSVDWPADGRADEVERTGPPPRRRGRWLWQILVAGFLALLLGASGLLFYLDRTFAGRIYPNVSIRGAYVGELRAEAAADVLRQRYAAFLGQPLTLTYGQRIWTPTLADLGVRVAIDEAVEHAYSAGRSHGFFANLSEVAAVWQSGLELPLHIVVDQAVMQRYLLDRAAEVEQPAVDAQLVLQDAQIANIPAVLGQQVLLDETIADITAAVQTLELQAVPLRTRQIQPSLDDAQVAVAQQRVADLLRGPIMLQVEDKTVEWPVAQLAQYVKVSRQGGASGAALEVTLDSAAIRAQLEAIAASSGRKGKYPRVAWNNGDLRITRPGTTGYQVDVARAEQLVLKALERPAAERMLTLPFATVSPPVSAANLDQLGLRELIAVGRSDFSGSAAYRITNIQAGMRLLDGILLAPGEEFSFNKNIGSIDASNGFVEGYAIVQNRTQLEWGGGICQDSTTMFRAAFWAGLPITERWGHSFYISWYDKYGFGDYGNGPGMDATIFTGGPDFKFLNDTGSWLLIQTSVDKSKTLAEVRIYGTATGRTVQIEGPVISNKQAAPSRPVYVPDPSRPRGSPRQSDKARGGMDISFTRIVKQNGVEVERETFVTRFKPWPNIFEINPADLGGDGRPAPVETPTPGPAESATPPADGSTPPVQAPPADGSTPPVEATPPPDGASPPGGQNPPPETPVAPPPNG